MSAWMGQPSAWHYCRALPRARQVQLAREKPRYVRGLQGLGLDSSGRGRCQVGSAM